MTARVELQDLKLHVDQSVVGTRVLRCYRSDGTICDGSCGKLLPCNACVELLLASERYR